MVCVTHRVGIFTNHEDQNVDQRKRFFMHYHQTQNVQRSSSHHDITPASRRHFEHAEGFDFNQKNGIQRNDKTQYAKDLLEKAQEGDLPTQADLEKLLDGNKEQEQLAEKLADELMQNSDEAVNKLSDMLHGAIEASNSGDMSNVDPHLLFILQSGDSHSAHLMSSLDQDESNDPNANPLATGLQNSFGGGLGSAAPYHDSPAPSSSGGIPSIFGTGDLNIDDFKGSLFMLLLCVSLAMATTIGNGLKLKIKLASSNKTANDKVQEAADAFEDIKEVMNMPSFKQKYPNGTDLTTLLNDPAYSSHLTHLQAFLKDQGGWDPTKSTYPSAADMKAAIASVNGYSDSLNGSNGSSLIPEGTYTKGNAIFFDLPDSATNIVSSASSILTNNSSISQQLLTEVQAQNQMLTQVLSMGATAVTQANQVSQTIFR